MQRFTVRKKINKKIKEGGFGGLVFSFSSFFVFLHYSVVPGGGKCPEEEHTTCSGGRTINCHKRGLRGEREFLFYKNKIRI
jgi:hypothetical protein